VLELAGAVNTLLSRPVVNPHQIYAVANSEGTIHAMKYQLEKEPKFAGLVLTGTPGRNLNDVSHTQLAAQVASLPNAKEIMAGYDKLMADFLAGKPFVADPALPDSINNLVRGFYTPINLPFAREIFAIDTAPLLAKITAPVLVVIGKKDVQVDWQVDGSLLDDAAKGLTNITFVYPENANHVLKNEPRPREALTAADALAYNASDRKLDADALKTVQAWLAVKR
jgi:pimeloyl-ACP methyl ester carboxylesterase